MADPDMVQVALCSADAYFQGLEQPVKERFIVPNIIYSDSDSSAGSNKHHIYNLFSARKRGDSFKGFLRMF
jgi:hypothetical protein